MPDRKLLFISDLDGTLLADNHQISRMNRLAIEQFRQMGGLFTLASGRMESAMAPFIEEINIDLPVIAYNGSMVFNPITKEILFHQVIHAYDGIINILKQMSQQFNLGVQVYQAGYSFGYGSHQILEASRKKEHIQILPLDMLDEIQPITKILLIAEDKSSLEVIESRIEDTNRGVELIYSEELYLEILPLGVSKGKALEILVQYLFPNKDFVTIAVGDNLNDLSLLLQADYGFYVENAHSELKRMEFIPTVNHQNHAIKDIFENFIKEKFLGG